MKKIITTVIVLLLSQCFQVGLKSQAITSKIEINAGEIKHFHASESGNEWVLTTVDHIVLWDDNEKKVRWSVPNSNHFTNSSHVSYPSKAVISEGVVYQVDKKSNAINVLDISNGSISKKVTFPNTNGYFGLQSIIALDNSPNTFLIPTTLLSARYDSLVTIGKNRFLLKDITAMQSKFTPDGKFFVVINIQDVNGRGELVHDLQVYNIDDTHLNNIKRPLSKRYHETKASVKVLLPAQDGKHIYRSRNTGSIYAPKYNLEKIFGLTKKEVAAFTPAYTPLLMDYFGKKEQLIVYTAKDFQFEWLSVNTETWGKSKLNLQLPEATSLFNDPLRDRLFVADKSGSLWVLENNNASGQIASYNSSGEAQSIKQSDLANEVAKTQTDAAQSAAIKQVENSRENPKTNPDYFSNLAFDYSDKGMYAAAEVAMKKIYDINKDQPVYVGYMAWFTLLNNKPSEAQDLAVKAYELARFGPLAPTIASYAYVATGDMAKGKEYLKIAIGNTVETKDGDDIAPDIKTMKSIGYNASQFDQLYTYYAQLFKSVTQTRINNLNLFDQAQKDQNPSSALLKFENAIKSEEALLAPRSELLGAAYSEASAKSRSLGDLNKAMKYGKKAVDILKPYGKEGMLCGALVNAGHAHNQAGLKDEAIAYYEAGLEIINRLGGETIVYKDPALNGLGGAYQEIGEYNRALTYYEDALKIAKSKGQRMNIAIAQDNVATVYIEQGKNVQQALSLLKQGQTTYQSSADKMAQANNHNNMAFAYMLLGDLNNAVSSFKTAENLYRALNMKSNLADVNRSIGKLLIMLDKKIDAIEYYKKSLQYVDETADPRTALSTYANLAGAELGQEDYNNAAIHAKKAIDINERLLKDAKGKTKRGLRSSTNNTYRILSLAQFRSGNFGGAFEAHEKNRSRLMLEKLGGGTTATVSEIQRYLEPNQAIIDYNLVHLHWEVNSHLFPIVVTNSSVRGKEFSDSTLVYDLKQEGEATFSAYLNHERSALKQIREFIQEKGIPDNVAQSLVRDSNLEKTIEFYRYLIKHPSPSNEVLRKSYARVFYKLLVGSLKTELSGKTELVIIPDGPLAFLPFETLIDDNGQYLAEIYKIKYIQSASILKKLNERNYPDSRKPLLAFGGPVFEEMSGSEVNKYRGSSGQVDFSDIQKTYYAAEENNASMRPTYIKMGFTKMTPLPGTIYETDQIKGIVAGAELYQRDAASENQFKSLASANSLKNYKVLHFATHGWAYGEIPELSTIVLGQYASPKGNEDGYLRVPEIEKLNLQADFVNLSACETALGRLYSSEGVVGLTQAFLVAGAKGISVTQWTVSDEGTAIFMSEMYRKVFTRGQTFQDAIAATKVEFIQGKYGDKFKHPDYWGPFVYYGI
ncbi:MAG: CHAT domain-containing protein [Cyclobacteriaceae bacterium]